MLSKCIIKDSLGNNSKLLLSYFQSPSLFPFSFCFSPSFYMPLPVPFILCSVFPSHNAQASEYRRPTVGLLFKFNVAWPTLWLIPANFGNEPVCRDKITPMKNNYRRNIQEFLSSKIFPLSMMTFNTTVSTKITSVLLYWRIPQWSVAVLTTWCQTSLSLAFLQAVWTPKFKDWTKIVAWQIFN